MHIIIQIRASLTDNITYQLAFDVSVFDGVITGSLSADFDSSMSLDLSLTAGASASITPTQANSTSATSQLGGCANLGAAVELDLGGEGGILGFIPVQASGPVFMKNFNLFQVRTFGVESLLDVY